MSIPLSDNVDISANKLLDKRRGPWVGANEAAAIAAAVAGVPSAKRVLGLDIILTIAGVPTPYIWKTGIGDTDLAPMGGGVTSFNFRTGIVQLTTLDVTTALGYTPVTSSDLGSEGSLRVSGDANTLASAKGYADGLLVSVYKDCGNADLSGGSFPTTGGTGTSGAIKSGNAFEVSVAGTVGGEAFDVGDIIRALVDTPGQTLSNWARSEHNTQQATQTTRGTAMIASTSDATTGTDDAKYMTAAKTQAQYVNNQKNYQIGAGLSRGNAFANEALFYITNAGNITAMAVSQITNIKVKTTLGGTYATPSYPIAVTAGSTFYVQFDFSNPAYLNGNIAITGKDN